MSLTFNLSGNDVTIGRTFEATDVPAANTSSRIDGDVTVFVTAADAALRGCILAETSYSPDSPIEVTRLRIGDGPDPEGVPPCSGDGIQSFETCAIPLWVPVSLGMFVIGYVHGEDLFGSAPDANPESQPLAPVIYNEREEPIGTMTANGAALSDTRPFDLLTHCGIDGAFIDGGWWKARTPLNENGNPPEGWDNPTQSGTLYFTAEDQAVFATADGPWVVLLKAPSEAPTKECD